LAAAAAGAALRIGMIDAPQLRGLIAGPDSVCYFCGPVPFMAAVNAALKQLGVAERDRRYEFFGPAGDLEAAATAAR